MCISPILFPKKLLLVDISPVLLIVLLALIIDAVIAVLNSCPLSLSILSNSVLARLDVISVSSPISLISNADCGSFVPIPIFPLPEI